MNSPIANLREVAEALAELRERAVFVGGATLGLLVTDPAAPEPRPTDDVDAIAAGIRKLSPTPKSAI